MADRQTQMSLIDDTSEVLNYLEFARDKEWITDDAMHCRLTACNKMFTVLEEDERNADYVLKHLNVLTQRFREKNKGARPNTVKVYKSRLKSSLEEFLSWSQDPIGWEHSIEQLQKQGRGEGRSGKEGISAGQSPGKRLSAILKDRKKAVRNERLLLRRGVGAVSPRKVSFPLRSDFELEMTVPQDGLTAKELLRIGLFLYSFCADRGEDRPDPSRLI